MFCGIQSGYVTHPMILYLVMKKSFLEELGVKQCSGYFFKALAQTVDKWLSGVLKVHNFTLKLNIYFWESSPTEIY